MSWNVIFFWCATVLSIAALAGAAYVLMLAVVGRWLWKTRPSGSNRLAPRTHFLILIPAHNEEQGIGPTLESLQAQNYPPGLTRIIVIADNCDDKTARVVRGAGFECLERNEPSSRGKGQALRWALDRLISNAWDAAVFIDADSRVGPEFLGELDRAIQGGFSAIQARYDFELADHSYLSLLTFASKSAENTLFWRPRERFGLMGFIVGNGFCLAREVLRAFPWGAYSIVEDVEYAVQLALGGVRVRFLETTQVVSRATRRVGDAAPQRLRWASGTLQVIRNYVPRLLQMGVKKGSIRLLEMALALTFASRFFLAYLISLSVFCCLVLRKGGPTLLPRGLTAAAVLLFCAYVVMAVSEIPNVGRGRLRAVVALPWYMSWMLLVHVAAARMRRGIWVRTAR